MRGLGLSAAGAAAAATTGSLLSSPAKAADNDIAVLQFALNLEFLEAEFYMKAAFGSGISPANSGPSPGYVRGGRQVAFSNPLVKAYASEIALEERKHVLFLSAALQAANGAISRPNLDLDTSFKTLGQIAGLGSDFDPFANDLSFMLGAYVFEDVGVTAYHGALTLISNPTYLDKASGILATEAYHAGIIRTYLFSLGRSGLTQAISNVRATLDGTYHTPNIDDYGVGTVDNPRVATVSDPMNGTSNNFAIAYDRTPRQVLNIVYGGVNATSGLFFPSGMNGTITS